MVSGNVMSLPKTSAEPVPSGRMAHRHLITTSALSTYSQRVYSIRPSFITLGDDSLTGLSESTCRWPPSRSIRYSVVAVSTSGPSQRIPRSQRVETKQIPPSGK